MTTMKLSEFIKEDLKNSIAATGRLPARPSLPALAEHYQVSLTPVRAAVRELVRENYLLKGRNGRLAVNPDHPGNGEETVELQAPERPRDWEAVLSEEVLRLSLSGHEGYLREEATAERYGIGRTVVRQTLIRLAGAGLVEHVPRRGWLVRTFSFEDLCDFLAVREVLELKALQLVEGRLDKGTLRKILAGNTARKGRPPRLDNRLHEYLIAESGNRFIREFFSQPIALYYQALLDHAAPATSVVAKMAKQHCEILRALIAEDWSRARKATTKHIRSQREVVRELMASANHGRKFQDS